MHLCANKSEGARTELIADIGRLRSEVAERRGRVLRGAGEGRDLHGLAVHIDRGRADGLRPGARRGGGVTGCKKRPNGALVCAVANRRRAASVRWEKREDASSVRVIHGERKEVRTREDGVAARGDGEGNDDGDAHGGRYRPRDKARSVTSLRMMRMANACCKWTHTRAIVC